MRGLLQLLQTTSTSECAVLILATTLRLIELQFWPCLEEKDRYVIQNEIVYVGVVDKELHSYIKDNKLPEDNQLQQKFAAGDNCTLEFKWTIIEPSKLTIKVSGLVKVENNQAASTHSTHTEASFSLDLSSHFERNDDGKVVVKSMSNLNAFIDNEIIGKVLVNGVEGSGAQQHSQPHANSQVGHPTSTSSRFSPSNDMPQTFISPNYPGNPGMLVGPNHPLFRRYIPMGSRFDPIFPDNPLGMYPPPGVTPHTYPDDLGGDIDRGLGVPIPGRGRSGFFNGGNFRGGFH